MSAAAPSVTFHAGEGCPPSVDCARLARDFAALLVHFPKTVARVDARVLGDAAMSAAHRKFMDIDGTTDVMSFPAHDESDAAAEVEADLLIGAEVAVREASARGHSPEREILLYAVHGTLHACGFRDDTEASFAAIHAEEDRILTAGGLGSVYAAPDMHAAKDAAKDAHA